MPASALRKHRYILKINIELPPFACMYVVLTLKLYKLSSSLRQRTGGHRRLCKPDCSRLGCGNCYGESSFASAKKSPRDHLQHMRIHENMGFQKSENRWQADRKETQNSLQGGRVHQLGSTACWQKTSFKFEVVLSCGGAIKPSARYLLVRS